MYPRSGKKYPNPKDGRNLRILIIGKTGNGKSTLGNIILGKDAFPVGTGMASTTVSTTCRSAVRNGRTIEVSDTPDVSNQCYTYAKLQEEVRKWKGCPDTTPDAVVLVVRCDVRYTKEEFAIYKEVKDIWGHDLCQRLVVAFTFGDRQDRDIDEELKTVCPELKSVLRDASGRYIVFKGPKSTDTEKENSADKLVKIVDNLALNSFHFLFRKVFDFVCSLILFCAVFLCSLVKIVVVLKVMLKNMWVRLVERFQGTNTNRLLRP